MHWRGSSSWFKQWTTGRRNSSTKPVRRGISAHQRRIPLGQLWYHLTMTALWFGSAPCVSNAWFATAPPDKWFKVTSCPPWACLWWFLWQLPPWRWTALCPHWKNSQNLGPIPSLQELGINFLHGWPGEVDISLWSGHSWWQGIRWDSSSRDPPEVLPWKHHKYLANNILQGLLWEWKELETFPWTLLALPLPTPLKPRAQSSQHVSGEKPLMCVLILHWVRHSWIFTWLRERLVFLRAKKNKVTSHPPSWKMRCCSQPSAASFAWLFVCFIFFLITF